MHLTMSKQFHLAHAGICYIIKTSFTTSSIDLKKVAGENVLKKYNKENKLLFGPLLETQAQKKKRLKRDASSPKQKKGPKQHSRKQHTKNSSESFSDESTVDEKSIAHYSKIFFETDITNMSLKEILKINFPLENPAKSNVSVQCTDHSQSNVPNNESLSKIYYPSVSSILRATVPEANKRALQNWMRRRIGLLGWQGFIEANNATLLKGRAFHMAIQQALTDRDKPLEFEEDILNCVKSAEAILKQITKVHAIEAEVKHSILQYRGYVDCICDMGNKTHVAIEWKKSDTNKNVIEKTYDAPLQTAAYMGAVNFDDRFSYQTTSGLVVVVYANGSAANAFPVSSEHWGLWYQRYLTFVRMNMVHIGQGEDLDIKGREELNKVGK